MEFHEPALESLDLHDPQCLQTLVIERLCGRWPSKDGPVIPKQALEKLIRYAEDDGLRHEQFNELLLLLDQERVSPAFFEFFFGTTPVHLDELVRGVVRFRGFAMLRFANCRYAFRRLSRCATKPELLAELEPYSADTEELKHAFEHRPGKAVRTDLIGREQTWYAGELTGHTINKEGKIALARCEERNEPTQQQQLREFCAVLDEMDDEYRKINTLALQNLYVYLTWDFLDIYVATSMRCAWQFEDTFDFIEQVFRHQALCDLQLRFFDPTQAKSRNPRDKGLVEGLMLKRAKCTIYMAQQADTMGKDSELATTLAQGRPVIVYVPKLEVEAYARKLRDYPIDYFYRRFLFLKAEGMLDEDRSWSDKLHEIDEDHRGMVSQFILEYEEYRRAQPFTLWRDRDEKEFKEVKEYFQTLCRILAVADKHAYETRAKTLTGKHPLTMQVDMRTGVAIGILVVRSPEECAKLLRSLLLNEAQFIIEDVKGQDEHEPDVEGQDEGEHEEEHEPGYWVLKEATTGSQFRVVTRDRKITNSFWNLFEGPRPIIGSGSDKSR